MEPIVRATRLGKGFHSGSGRVDVLRDLDLDLFPGELVSVAGASGSGKSTLLQILGGLMHPDAGRVELGGEALYELSDSKRAGIRNQQVGFVFQFHHLLPEFTALENVLLPAMIRNVPTSIARARALKLLAAMGVEKRASHKPGEMSGGEQQRVAVARALVNEPRVLLADEPSGNLDSHTSQALHGLLETLAAERRLALLIATHSPTLARRASRSLVLQDGALQELGKVEEWA